MCFRFAGNTGINTGTSAGGADGCRALATSGVRAIWRWTAPTACAHMGARRAARTGPDIATLSRRSTHWRGDRPTLGRRRPENRQLISRGGPGPLTEDRQKPRHRREGMHGTRNSVHAVAVVGVVRAGLDEIAFVLVGRRCDDRSGSRA